MPRKKCRVPRCAYGVIWDNQLTGQTAFIRCGNAGLTRSYMCSEPGKHPPAPDEVDDATGWPVLTHGWTLEDVQPPKPCRSSG